MTTHTPQTKIKTFESLNSLIQLEKKMNVWIMEEEIKPEDIIYCKVTPVLMETANGPNGTSTYYYYNFTGIINYVVHFMEPDKKGDNG